MKMAEKLSVLCNAAGDFTRYDSPVRYLNNISFRFETLYRFILQHLKQTGVAALRAMIIEFLQNFSFARISYPLEKTAFL
jgi:hypothetical protein